MDDIRKLDPIIQTFKFFEKTLGVMPFRFHWHWKKKGLCDFPPFKSWWDAGWGPIIRHLLGNLFGAELENSKTAFFNGTWSYSSPIAGGNFVLPTSDNWKQSLAWWFIYWQHRAKTRVSFRWQIGTKEWTVLGKTQESRQHFWSPHTMWS